MDACRAGTTAQIALISEWGGVPHSALLLTLRSQPTWSFSDAVSPDLLAALGAALCCVRGPDRHLRQDRGRERQLRSRHLHPHHRDPARARAPSTWGGAWQER